MWRRMGVAIVLSVVSADMSGFGTRWGLRGPLKMDGD